MPGTDTRPAAADSAAGNDGSPLPSQRHSGGIFRSFSYRSYRFQFSADTLMAWAAEMENLILGWYILVETGSPFLLGLFAALRFLGTLAAPFFGVIADRVDRRRMIITLRLVFSIMAVTLMVLALTGLLETWHIFIIATATGMTRIADNVARQALIADIVPRRTLMNAMGLSRTTQDLAKIAGALLGAGLFAQFGLGPAYIGVTVFYAGSVLLATGVTLSGRVAPPRKEPPYQTLKAGIRYVRGSSTIVAMMYLAFLVNLTVFPLTNGLMPVVARDVFGTDENGLARLLAVAAAGALGGSVLMAAFTRIKRPERVMLGAIVAWHVFLLAFAQMDTAARAYPVLAMIGMASSLSMVSMSVLLLTTATREFRGRVMGVRMLAVYGLPIGLLVGGALAEVAGIQTTLLIYGAVGLAMTAVAVVVWPQLWRGIEGGEAAERPPG